ncbi:flagellin [Tunturiibacter gelidoferens]|uniref:Flagellin n=3 Tax=Tunturiibacter TaxID=3154218 RepID=A0A7Y9NL35_9BACT|nr:flagellin [Edaphobacter lichenicola]MBB5339346.1 flagellin [Edaphobacter lichenicola]NYF51396.1 flagellin [Edaphobacter lichenicola]
MSLGILTNVAATYAENNLNSTQNSLQNVLQQLSSGSRINSGADDAAGLSIADGLTANQAALTQSAQNAQNGVGLLQTADGALSQVTNLLDRAVTLATEASNGGLTAAQSTAANTEFQSILTEIGNIGSTTNFNSTGVFNQAAGTTFNLTDGTATGLTTITAAATALTATSIGGQAFTAADTLAGATPQASALTTLTAITAAISGVSADRGAIGANINQLNAAASVASSEEVNLSSANSAIRATNFGQATSDLAKFQVLSQTGISALAQANSSQQEILKLLQ